MDRSLARFALIAAVATILTTACVAVAYAYDEPNGMPAVGHPGFCEDCHAPLEGPRITCGDSGGHCHAIHGELNATSGKGPHGLYSKTSDRCGSCHTLHDSGGATLLPSATVTDTCFSCHDGTGGNGVYRAVFARTGVQPASGHRFDTTSSVPGGDASTGGTSTMSLGGPSGTMGCDDCHSPHDTNTVAPYRVERWRTIQSNVNDHMAPGLTYRNATTSHLLRRNPGGSTATATVYGSDWCLACHAGRRNAGDLHNHPVDSGVGAFSWDGVALMASDAMTGTTVMGSMAETNRGYVMPYPRTAQQGAHKPICQQCHEDSRNVGVLSADGTQADAATYAITLPDGLPDGVTGVDNLDNPRFQNFPHETENATMLVEVDDNLCLNCHSPAQLP